MATKELVIKYRPVRIGFLVREGNIDDLVTAAGINSLLFGGIHNPIIPISKDNDFSKQLIRLYNIDIIHEIADDEDIKEFASKHEYDRDPFFISSQIFYEDGETKKQCLMYLDSLNLILHNYEKTFKDKPKGFYSDYIFPIWDNEHPLSNLFSISFGHYPKCYDLKDDFEGWFNTGLQASTINLNAEATSGDPKPEVSASIVGRITPIKLTGTELSGYGGTLKDNGIGIFVGDEDDFKDLCLFWNLRAAGTQIEFLPQKHVESFEDFITSHLKEADSYVTSSTRHINFISAYCRHDKYEITKELIKNFTTSNRLVAFPCDDEVRWNGFNVDIKNPHFYSKPSLASIAGTSSKYLVSFSLPNIPLMENQRTDVVEYQSLVASVEIPTEELAYPEHTLRVPPIRELNPFYGGRILSHPFRVKAEDRGLRILIRPKDHSLSLAPIPYAQLVKNVFGLGDTKAEFSQPGIITQQVIRKLNGIAGARIFQITGVRKLLNSLNKDEMRTRSQAEKTIFESDFLNFEQLFIEPRDYPKLTQERVFDFLLRKDFFRAGLDLVCNSCNLHNWLSLREIDDFWICSYCGNKGQTSPSLKHRGDWRFRKSGLFAKDNNQEGAIPVVLTLLQLHNSLSTSGYVYTTALNLTCASEKCETDFCVMTYDSSLKIRLGIGECKSEGGEITQEDVSNLKAIAERFKKFGIETYLIFSKTSETFTTEELNLFNELKKDYIPCILLTKKDLERHMFYKNIDDKIHIEHPFSLLELSINSVKLYLEATSPE